MVKSESHIDVLFRDGLQNTEVLPPESVWDNIEPSIRKKSNNAFFFRIAASIAVLTSLGLIAYFYASTFVNLNQSRVQYSELNELSTLFDASYLGINVKAEKSQSQDEEIFTDSQLAFYTTNEADRNTGPKAINDFRGIALSFDQPDERTLIYEDIPEEVKPDGGPKVLFVPEILAIEPVQDKRPENRWELGAMVSPTYLSTSLKVANEAISQMNDNEAAVLSYTGGFSLGFKMNKRLSIQTGLYYSSLGGEVNGVSSFAGFSPYASSKSGAYFGVKTSSGTINSTNSNIYLSDIAANRIDGFFNADNFDPLKSNLTPFGSRLRQNFEYLEVPLIIKYKFIDRKMDFNVLGGISYNFLVGNQTWAINNEGSKILIGSTEGVDNLLLSSSLGMSMEYNLTEKFSLKMEPQIRYFLNTGGDLGSGNPYTFGVFSGMHFRF